MLWKSSYPSCCSCGVGFWRQGQGGAPNGHLMKQLTSKRQIRVQQLHLYCWINWTLCLSIAKKADFQSKLADYGTKMIARFTWFHFLLNSVASSETTAQNQRCKQNHTGHFEKQLFSSSAEIRWINWFLIVCRKFEVTW